MQPASVTAATPQVTRSHFLQAEIFKRFRAELVEEEAKLKDSVADIRFQISYGHQKICTSKQSYKASEQEKRFRNFTNREATWRRDVENARSIFKCADFTVVQASNQIYKTSITLLQVPPFILTRIEEQQKELFEKERRLHQIRTEIENTAELTSVLQQAEYTVKNLWLKDRGWDLLSSDQKAVDPKFTLDLAKKFLSGEGLLQGPRAVELFTRVRAPAHKTSPDPSVFSDAFSSTEDSESFMGYCTQSSSHIEEEGYLTQSSSHFEDDSDIDTFSFDGESDYDDFGSDDDSLEDFVIPRLRISDADDDAIESIVADGDMGSYISPSGSPVPESAERREPSVEAVRVSKLVPTVAEFVPKTSSPIPASVFVSKTTAAEFVPKTTAAEFVPRSSILTPIPPSPTPVAPVAPKSHSRRSHHLFESSFRDQVAVLAKQHHSGLRNALNTLIVETGNVDSVFDRYRTIVEGRLRHLQIFRKVLLREMDYLLQYIDGGEPDAEFGLSREEQRRAWQSEIDAAKAILEAGHPRRSDFEDEQEYDLSVENYTGAAKRIQVVLAASHMHDSFWDQLREKETLSRFLLMEIRILDTKTSAEERDEYIRTRSDDPKIVQKLIAEIMAAGAGSDHVAEGSKTLTDDLVLHLHPETQFLRMEKKKHWETVRNLMHELIQHADNHRFPEIFEKFRKALEGKLETCLKGLAAANSEILQTMQRLVGSTDTEKQRAIVRGGIDEAKRASKLQSSLDVFPFNDTFEAVLEVFHTMELKVPRFSTAAQKLCDERRKIFSEHLCCEMLRAELTKMTVVLTGDAKSQFVQNYQHADTHDFITHDMIWWSPVDGISSLSTQKRTVSATIGCSLSSGRRGKFLGNIGVFSPDQPSEEQIAQSCLEKMNVVKLDKFHANTLRLELEKELCQVINTIRRRVAGDNTPAVVLGRMMIALGRNVIHTHSSLQHLRTRIGELERWTEGELGQSWREDNQEARRIIDLGEPQPASFGTEESFEAALAVYEWARSRSRLLSAVHCQLATLKRDETVLEHRFRLLQDDFDNICKVKSASAFVKYHLKRYCLNPPPPKKKYLGKGPPRKGESLKQGRMEVKADLIGVLCNVLKQTESTESADVIFDMFAAAILREEKEATRKFLELKNQDSKQSQRATVDGEEIPVKLSRNLEIIDEEEEGEHSEEPRQVPTGSTPQPRAVVRTPEEAAQLRILGVRSRALGAEVDAMVQVVLLEKIPEFISAFENLALIPHEFVKSKIRGLVPQKKKTGQEAAGRSAGREPTDAATRADAAAEDFDNFDSESDSESSESESNLAAEEVSHDADPRVPTAAVNISEQSIAVAMCVLDAAVASAQVEEKVESIEAQNSEDEAAAGAEIATGSAGIGLERPDPKDDNDAGIVAAEAGRDQIPEAASSAAIESGHIEPQESPAAPVTVSAEPDISEILSEQMALRAELIPAIEIIAESGETARYSLNPFLRVRSIFTMLVEGTIASCNKTKTEASSDETQARLRQQQIRLDLLRSQIALMDEITSEEKQLEFVRDYERRCLSSDLVTLKAQAPPVANAKPQNVAAPAPKKSEAPTPKVVPVAKPPQKKNEKVKRPSQIQGVSANGPPKAQGSLAGKRQTTPQPVVTKQFLRANIIRLNADLKSKVIQIFYAARSVAEAVILWARERRAAWDSNETRTVVNSIVHRVRAQNKRFGGVPLVSMLSAAHLQLEKCRLSGDTGTRDPTYLSSFQIGRNDISVRWSESGFIGFSFFQSFFGANTIFITSRHDIDPEFFEFHGDTIHPRHAVKAILTTERFSLSFFRNVIEPETPYAVSHVIPVDDFSGRLTQLHVNISRILWELSDVQYYLSGAMLKPDRIRLQSLIRNKLAEVPTVIESLDSLATDFNSSAARFIYDFQINIAPMWDIESFLLNLPKEYHSVSMLNWLHQMQWWITMLREPLVELLEQSEHEFISLAENFDFNVSEFESDTWMQQVD